MQVLNEISIISLHDTIFASPFAQWFATLKCSMQVTYRLFVCIFSGMVTVVQTFGHLQERGLSQKTQNLQFHSVTSKYAFDETIYCVCTLWRSFPSNADAPYNSDFIFDIAHLAWCTSLNTDLLLARCIFIPM